MASDARSSGPRQVRRPRPREGGSHQVRVLGPPVDGLLDVRDALGREPAKAVGESRPLSGLRLDVLRARRTEHGIRHPQTSDIALQALKNFADGLESKGVANGRLWAKIYRRAMRPEETAREDAVRIFLQLLVYSTLQLLVS